MKMCHLNRSNQVNRSTKNVDEVDLQGQGADVVMTIMVKTFVIFLVLCVLMDIETVNARKRSRRRKRHFCPSSRGESRPAILNVQASFQPTQGNAIFRVNTCRDSPACFLATTNETSPLSVEDSLWQKLLDAFMGKLDIEPTFQFKMKTSFKNAGGSNQEHILSGSIPSSILMTYPNLDRLCKDAYGVYNFIQVKNLTRSPTAIPQVQTISELLLKLARNDSRSNSTGIQKPSRRARAQWKKLSLQKMFLSCASCSRICVQNNNPDFFNRKIVFCSTIRIKCAFQCGILERLMKSKRIARKL